LFPAAELQVVQGRVAVILPVFSRALVSLADFVQGVVFIL
jgi:hypothetical protein